MPRKARIDAPGALHHIIVRGIERKAIFHDDKDRNNFLARLGLILVQTETLCFAWALIPNHVHLLLRTGESPIATVMRRLLTGYAVSFNRRHNRSGHLFQNRYKSILCQEDLYFLELVRYIHLNPLRARLVKDLQSLDSYKFCGHSVLMGKKDRDWQNTDYVLGYFGKTLSISRKGYRNFVQKGVSIGRRTDLVGGGLIRSAGGWSSVRALQKSGQNIKSDERILGDSDFVDSVLQNAQESLERRYAIQAAGYDFNWLVNKVATSLNMTTEDVTAPGKYAKAVKARSLLCYWGVREFGMTTVELAERLRLAQPTISQAVARGRSIAKDFELKISSD